MRWTDDAVIKLRELRSAGVCAREIGIELGCGRNAVLGKAARLGLIAPVVKKLTDQEKLERRNRRRRTKAAARLIRIDRKSASNPQSNPVSKSSELIEPLNLSIDQLQSFHCRWITNDDLANAEYCGHHTVDDSSWCRHHLDIVNPPRRELSEGEGRLLRNYEPAPLSVWPMATQAFSEAHFATFPPELAERCIKAGCPAGGSVLDPFGGAGTTALVAATLGCTATLIELNPEYATLARARIEAAFMGKDEGSRHMAKQLGKVAPAFEPGSLFAGIEAAE